MKSNHAVWGAKWRGVRAAAVPNSFVEAIFEAMFWEFKFGGRSQVKLYVLWKFSRLWKVGWKCIIIVLFWVIGGFVDSFPWLFLVIACSSRWSWCQDKMKKMAQGHGEYTMIEEKDLPTREPNWFSLVEC